MLFPAQTSPAKAKNNAHSWARGTGRCATNFDRFAGCTGHDTPHHARQGFGEGHNSICHTQAHVLTFSLKRPASSCIAFHTRTWLGAYKCRDIDKLFRSFGSAAAKLPCPERERDTQKQTRCQGEIPRKVVRAQRVCVCAITLPSSVPSMVAATQTNALNV